MATTTNYGWATPDDTDLVKDGAAAIRTLGSSADTTVKNLSPGTTAGDLDYYTSGTAKARLGIGTAGQVLKVNSGATAPEWGASGGGKVLQVVNAQTSTLVTSATSSYVDTTLTATITPSAATSTVLVFVSQNGVAKLTGNTSVNIKLLRDATDLQLMDDAAGNTANTDRNHVGTVGTTYLDSPATTAATTYKTQFKSQAGIGNARVQEGLTVNSVSTITLMEIGA